MGVFHFPSNFVYWRKIPNHHIFKEKILNYVENNKDSFFYNPLVYNALKTDGTNNDFSNEFLKDKEMVNSIIWDTMEEMLTEINSREDTIKTNITSSSILESWIVKYDENSTISVHNHENQGRSVFYINGKKWFTSFSIIYIINDPNKKNNTEFIQTKTHYVSSHIVQNISFKTEFCKDISEGTVLIFPSNLDHQAIFMKEPGRVILSCNIISCDEDSLTA